MTANAWYGCATSSRIADQTTRGLFVDGQAALGTSPFEHCRPGGRSSATRRMRTTRSWIVFNGEIYNHQSVRERLESAGHRYKSRSDTETILHAYEHWGDAAVEQLRGMFAFAIWDSTRRRLLLARDRLGVKPLYWARSGRSAAIRVRNQSHPGERARFEPRRTKRPPGTPQHAISLRDGNPVQGHPSPAARAHVLTFDKGEIAIREYWDIPAATSITGGRVDLSEAHIVRRFRICSKSRSAFA